MQAFLRDGLLLRRRLGHGGASGEARALKSRLKVHAGTDKPGSGAGADIIFVCVKPQVVTEVVRQISPHVNRTSC